MKDISDEKIAIEIKKILTDKFGLNQDIDINTSIFSDVIYLDSLKVTMLVSEIEKTFDIEIDFQVVIDIGFDTVNDIIKIINVCYLKKHYE